MQTATTFFNNAKCYLPDQGNVCHYTKKFTKTGLDTYIEYLKYLFAAAKASLILIRIPMIPGIVVVFCTPHLTMVTRERIFTIWRANQGIKEIFLKVLKKMFLSFE